MLGVVVVYLGLIAAFLGGVSFLRPLSFLAIRTRRRAALVLALSFIVVVMGGSLPAREVRVATPRTQLDQFAPAYQFSEFYSIRIAAPKEEVYRALKFVPADQIVLFRMLTWLRRFGHPGPGSILNPPPHVPVLDVAARTGTKWGHAALLGHEPPRGSERSSMNARAKTFGSPSGEPSTTTRPMLKQMCEKLWTLPHRCDPTDNEITPLRRHGRPVTSRPLNSEVIRC